MEIQGDQFDPDNSTPGKSSREIVPKKDVEDKLDKTEREKVKPLSQEKKSETNKLDIIIKEIEIEREREIEKAELKKKKEAIEKLKREREKKEQELRKKAENVKKNKSADKPEEKDKDITAKKAVKHAGIADSTNNVAGLVSYKRERLKKEDVKEQLTNIKGTVASSFAIRFPEKPSQQEIQREKFRKRKKREPIPQIFPHAQGKETELSSSEQEKEATQPVIDVPISLPAAFILDLNQEIDSPINQKRLELMKRWAQGAIGNPESLYDLRAQGDLLHSFIGGLETEVQALSDFLDEHPELSYAQLKDNYTQIKKELDRAPDEVLTSIEHIKERIADLQAQVDELKQKYEDNPFFLPLSQDRSDVPPQEALAYFTAHIGSVQFKNKEAMQDYRKRVQDSKAFPLVQQLKAMTKEVSLLDRYEKDERLLPPAPDLSKVELTNDRENFIDVDVAPAYLWLKSFSMSKGAFEEKMKKYAHIFSAFGQDASRMHAHIGKLDMSTIVSPEGYNHDRATRELAVFYSTVYPTLAFHAFHDNHENPSRPASHLVDWFKNYGLQRGFLREDLREPGHDKLVSLESGDPEQYVYKLSEFLSMLRECEADFESKSGYTEENPIIKLTRAVDPGYSTETAGDRTSITDLLIKGLIKQGYLVRGKGKDKDTLYYASDVSDYVDVNFLALSAGLSNPEDMTRFAQVCADVTKGERRFEASRFLPADTAIDIISQKLKDNEIAPKDAAYWLLPANFPDAMRDHVCTAEDGGKYGQVLSPANKLNRILSAIGNARGAAETLSLDKLTKPLVDYESSERGGIRTFLEKLLEEGFAESDSIKEEVKNAIISSHNYSVSIDEVRTNFHETLQHVMELLKERKEARTKDVLEADTRLNELKKKVPQMEGETRTRIPQKLLLINDPELYFKLLNERKMLNYR